MLLFPASSQSYHKLSKSVARCTSIFVGAPSTCSEKVVIPLTYFLKKITWDSLSPTLPAFPLLLPTFSSLLPHLSFSYCCFSRHRRFHLLLPLRGGCGKRFFFFFNEELATIVAVNRRLPWRGGCHEEVARCIEEASVKSNAIIHRWGSFVTVHRRGKRRNHVVSAIVAGVRMIR